MKRVEIPGYSNYKINKKGEVYRAIDGKKVFGSTNPKGYVNHRLKGDDGKTMTIGRHRLLALTFIPFKGDVSKMTVNHKNGIKGDDRLSNLEWATYQQNQEHAGRAGLTTKCIPITVVNEETGLETYYDSYIKCARDLGITKDAVAWRVSKGPNKVWPDGNRYKKSRDAKPWGETVQIANGRKRVTLVKDIKKDTVYIFEDLTNAAKALKINLSAAYNWASDKSQPVIPGFFIIQFQDLFKEWREIDDVYIDLQKTVGRRFVVRVNLENDEVVLFTSLKACAIDSNLNASTMHGKLKDGVNKIGNCCFWYYNDLPKTFKTKVRLFSDG